MCWTFTEEDCSIPISAEGNAKRTSANTEKGGDDEGDHGSLLPERWVRLGGCHEWSPWCEVLNETDASLLHSFSVHSHSCSYTCLYDTKCKKNNLTAVRSSSWWPGFFPNELCFRSWLLSFVWCRWFGHHTLHRSVSVENSEKLIYDLKLNIQEYFS
jgi:hypothetical protein